MSNSLKNWKNKTVIVTGAGSGIGKSLCFELAERGAIVYVTARSLDKCQPIVDEIKAKGYKAHAAQLEVSNFKECQKVIDQVVKKHDQLDVFINNAGMLFMGEYFDMETSDIEKIVSVNLTSVMVANLYAYQSMKSKGSGLIVNVSSMAGFLPSPAMVAYSTTKHALLGLTKSLGAEAEGSGVRVQALCLGLIESELLDKADVKKGHGSMYLEIIPMKPMSTLVAAKKLVNGMMKNKQIVYLPWYARFYHHLYYFLPTVLYKGAAFTMTKYRELIESEK